MKNNILLTEQLFSKLLRSIADPVTRASVQNSIKAVATDLLRSTTGDISLNALKSNNAYKNALLTSLEELSQVKYGKAWDTLDDAQQTIVANEASVALRNGIEYEIKATGRKITGDIRAAQAAQAAVPSSSPLASQLANQITDLQNKLTKINTDALTNVRSIGAITKEEITELIKGGITSTSTQTASNAKGFRYYFDKTLKRLVPIPQGSGKAVKFIYFSRAALKTAMWLGLGYGVYWFFSTIFPDSDFVVVDENGQPLNLDEITSGNLLKCVDNILKHNGSIVQANQPELTYIKLENTGENEYDSHGGLKFFLNGRVAYGDDSKKGTWTCSLTGEVEQVNESSKKLSLVSLIEQAQKTTWRDGVTINWDQTDSEVPKPQQNFVDCSTWDISVKPYTLGCKAKKISYIQKCIGDEPLDGIFDERLQKALAYANIDASNGISRAVFDEMMRRCSQGTQQPSQQPSQQAPAPEQVQQTTLEFDSNDFSGKNESGASFYERLFRYGYFRKGKLGDRKIKYKDNALSKNDYDKLTNYFKGYGYTPLLTKDVGDGEFKYVWIKRR